MEETGGRGLTAYRGIGKAGMALAAAVAGAMCVLSLLAAPATRLSGGQGICLPSPNLWNIPGLWSWAGNVAMIAVMAIGAMLLNRHYNFIRSTQPVLPAMFLVLTASNPIINEYLSASTLICAVNLIALTILFSCYRQDNATQQMFVIATLISVGSMFQYAFIPYIFAYIIGAVVMKAFRFKEFLATCMGLIAPYWVGVGMGLIDVGWFSMPEFTDLFNGYAQAPELFILMLSVGTAIFAGLLLGVNNSIKLYAGNSKVNALNLAIDLVGIVSIICVLIDFSNMLAYLTTLYLTVAVQIANLCALWHFRKEWLIVFVPAVIYTGFFIALLLT